LTLPAAAELKLVGKGEGMTKMQKMNEKCRRFSAKNSSNLVC
jgi:hypothetical protein